MASLEEQLKDYQKQIAKLLPDMKQKEAANVAGAKAFQQNLTKVTREKHYSNKKDEKYGHMADHIEVSKRNADNVADGSATVGWPNRYHAMNAMRLNDGTIHIKADHFVDQCRQDSANDVLEAQAKVLGIKGD